MTDPMTRPEPATLSHEQARRVYDRIGARQDSQAFYEDAATDRLLAHGRFDAAGRVFEFGCGTGRFARRLLSAFLPDGARYRGIDLSPTMVALARAGLAPFADRAEVVLSDGGPPTAEPAGSCDRFVSNYVLDLLAEAEIEGVLREAHRMLVPGGLVCLSSLGTGSGPLSRAVARIWAGVHAWRPALVGGCRPLALRPRLPAPHWQLLHHAAIAPFGIPSEVLVAERR